MLRKILCTPAGKLRLPIVVIGSFFIAFFSFIPGLGFPGVLMLGIGDSILPWTMGFLGYKSFTYWPSYSKWGSALFLTFSLFPFLILAYVIVFRWCSKQPKWKQWLIWAAIFILWSTVATALIYYYGIVGLPRG